MHESATFLFPFFFKTPLKRACIDEKALNQRHISKRKRHGAPASLKIPDPLKTREKGKEKTRPRFFQMNS